MCKVSRLITIQNANKSVTHLNLLNTQSSINKQSWQRLKVAGLTLSKLLGILDQTKLIIDILNSSFLNNFKRWIANKYL